MVDGKAGAGVGSRAKPGQTAPFPKSEEGANGCYSHALVADFVVSSNCVCGQLDYAHGAAVSPQRLQETARRRQSAGGSAAFELEPRPIHLPVLHAQGHEIARDDRKAEGGTGWHDDGFSKR